MPYASAYASGTYEVRPVTLSVSLSVEPRWPWFPGQAVRLTARVTGGAGQPMAGVPVSFSLSFYAEYRTVEQGIGTATTDQSGAAALSWTVPWRVGNYDLPCRAVTLRARAGAAEATVTGSVAYQTRVEVAAPATVYAGQEFEVTGRALYQSGPGVWSPIEARDVEVYADGQLVARARTAIGDGSFRARVRLPSPGTYSITAVFPGWFPPECPR